MTKSKRRHFGARGKKREQSFERRIEGPRAQASLGEPAEVDLGPFSGPTADLAQDPVRVRLALDRLRIEHAELWLTANELKDKLHETMIAKASAEEAIHRMRSIFDHAPAALVVVDRAGVIRRASFATARLLYVAGAPIEPSALEGGPLAAFFDAEDEGALSSALGSATVGRTVEVVLRLRLRAGRAIMNGPFAGDEAPAHPRVRVVARAASDLPDELLIVLQDAPRDRA